MTDASAWIAEGRTRLLTYVRRRIRDPEQAEDIVQEAIMRVIEQERKQVIDQPLAYGFRVADSVIYNRGRRGSGTHAPVDPELACALPLADEILDYRQRYDRFQAALSRLPAQRRAVFVERHLEGKSRQQIAEDMGLSVEAVKKHLLRAMIDLDGCIDDLPVRGGRLHD
ncbi:MULTISPECIES: RNA polymerase sigma factor [Sphingomonas]|jgi:RNA polymerase sigma factor (sigma-70 family)|uniref:RNA polymerase sigma factor n=1 Tax=Sphingomonas TaxID=13687 RepID=UPI0009757107|nr:sigma-70 family RNA polymerase sigma factor [Sphingomonas sp. Sph1(2015)]OMJ33803.1 RNA polymerase subunit sigma-70 [Sphingomonas sp. Sph1(2015)]